MATRILIVDDEANVSNMLARVLRRAGYRVTMAGDGAEALEKMKGEPPDLIVLDWVMPGMDGLEALHRIRANAETAHIPVLMLTAKARLEDKMASFTRGADDYVSKPFELSEVLARVQALLKRTQQTRLTSPLMGLLGNWSSVEGLAQLGRDLEAAREIQLRLLPAVPARLAGLDAGAVLHPSTVVGGDFFDVIPLGDQIGVTVGDVSGKGIPAALFMIMVRTLLREVAGRAGEPREILSRLNESLCRDMPPSMFVTIVLTVLDPARPGRLLVANGGHPEPVVIRSGAAPARVDVGGTVLGAFKEGSFEQVEVNLDRGDSVVLFTDGVVETADEGGRRTGFPGLVAVLDQYRDLSAPALARAVADDVIARGGARMRDDLTVFVLQR
jgi:phosphoserine phosphatase RsbU/P